MEKLRDNRVFLEMLAKSNNKYRKTLLAGAPPEIIHLLSECALNILKGSIVLTKEEKAKLRPHKEDLRKLATGKTGPRTKKKIIQKGGFIRPLLKPVLKAALPHIVNHIVNSL